MVLYKELKSSHLTTFSGAPVIITSSQARRQTSTLPQQVSFEPMSPSFSSASSSCDDTSDGQSFIAGETQVRAKRKREKLDHLTQEEKLMRRKMKNRISAQTARDRKKAKLDDLEDNLTSLCQERTELLEKNKELIQLNQELKKENERLREELKREERLSSSVVLKESSPHTSKSIESAELINEPQQKGQGLIKTVSIPWMQQFICWLAMMRKMMMSFNGSTSVLRSCLIQELKTFNLSEDIMETLINLIVKVPIAQGVGIKQEMKEIQWEEKEAEVIVGLASPNKIWNPSET